MPNFDKHIFVCTNTRPDGHPRGCCSSKGSEAIRDRLKDLTGKHGHKGKVRINAAGCLDQCEHGVTIVVYPEGVWYGFLTLGDVEEFFESHVLRGVPVKRLRLKPECINTPTCEHRRGNF